MIYMISIAVLVLSAIPAVKLCFQPALWSQFRSMGFILIAILTFYVTGIVITWQFFPWLLPYVAFVIGLPAIFAWWRARSAYGTNKGLPIGSLSMVQSLQSLEDPGFYLEHGNKYDHVFKMSQFHRPTLCVTSIEKGLDLIRNNEDNLRPAPLPFDRFIPRRFIRFMEPDDHQHYRKLFIKIIRPEIFNLNKKLIQKAAAEHLGKMCKMAREQSAVNPMPFMRDFTFDVFPAIFFGFETGSHEFEQIKVHFQRLDNYSLGDECPDEAENTLHDIEALVLARSEEFSRIDNNGLRRSFLEELVHHDSEAINDVTLRRNMIYMMRMGRADVTGFLNWIWYFLSMNPVWLETLEKEVEPPELRNWRHMECTADRIIAEALRMEQSEYLYREVINKMDWNGLHIPKGWLLRVCIHEGHLNPSAFQDPGKFDPDRFLTEKFMPTMFSPLGMGKHSCLGTHMVFMVARCLILQIASGYEVSLVNAGKRTRSGRHWMHWRPGDAFAVKIHPSDATSLSSN